MKKMHVAPLLVLMNAQTPEERLAVGQVLLYSFTPTLNKSQTRTIAALSAQQSVANLSRQLARRYRDGRKDLENEILEEMKSLLMDAERGSDDAGGGLNRILKRLSRFLDENSEKIMKQLQHNELVVSLLDDETEVSMESIKTILRTPNTATPDNPDVQRQLTTDDERRLLTDFGKVYEVMRGKRKKEKLTSWELDSTDVLKTRLEHHDMLNAIDLSDK